MGRIGTRVEEGMRRGCEKVGRKSEKRREMKVWYVREGTEGFEEGRECGGMKRMKRLRRTRVKRKKLSKIRKKLGNGGDKGVEEEVDKGRRMRQAKKRDTRIRGEER